MSLSAPTTSSDNARRIDELGRIIIAYSEVTEKLQQSHDQLTETVRALQSELGEKNRLLERKNRLAASTNTSRRDDFAGRSPNDDEASRVPRLLVITMIALVKSLVRPRASVSLPSPSTWSSRSNTCGAIATF